jgi:hypothetical protein
MNSWVFAFLLLVGLPSFAQTRQGLVRDSILSHFSEDDTVRALAMLFERKSAGFKAEKKKLITTSLVSIGLATAGALMLTHGPVIIDVLGIIPFAAGSFGLLFATAIGIHYWIVTSRYSTQKFSKLVNDYRAGKGIPKSYVRKMKI